MNTIIIYYYENSAGIFSVIRKIKPSTLKDIENSVRDIKVLILASGDKPLNHEVIFK